MSNLPADLPQMVDAIVCGYHPQRIVLFGSYARGAAVPPHSDLDLLVVKEGVPNNRMESARIRSCIRRWIGPYAFTILPISLERLKQRLELKETFIQTILEEGIDLYAADQ